MLSNMNRKYIFIRPRCFCGNDAKKCFDNVRRAHKKAADYWKLVCFSSISGDSGGSKVPGLQNKADKNDCYIKYCNSNDNLKEIFCKGSCVTVSQRDRLTSSHACATLGSLITPALV